MTTARDIELALWKRSLEADLAVSLADPSSPPFFFVGHLCAAVRPGDGEEATGVRPPCARQGICEEQKSRVSCTGPTSDDAFRRRSSAADPGDNGVRFLPISEKQQLTSSLSVFAAFSVSARNGPIELRGRVSLSAGM